MFRPVRPLDFAHYLALYVRRASSNKEANQENGAPKSSKDPQLLLAPHDEPQLFTSRNVAAAEQKTVD